jgi:hypothetical protein
VLTPYEGVEASRIKLLRTIPWFTRLLVGLFLVAQFAGMVSSPRADAMPVTSAGAFQMDALHMDASRPIIIMRRAAVTTACRATIAIVAETRRMHAARCTPVLPASCRPSWQSPLKPLPASRLPPAPTTPRPARARAGSIVLQDLCTESRSARARATD